MPEDRSGSEYASDRVLNGDPEQKSYLRSAQPMRALPTGVRGSSDLPRQALVNPLLSPLRRLLLWGNTAYWEAAGLILLGLLLVVYRWRGTLLMLINPNYVNVALLAGLCLLGLGMGRWRGAKAAMPETHSSLLGPRLGAGLLLLTALLGFWIEPQPLSSQTALNRGVSPYLGVSRSQPQAFRPKIDPRQRTLLDWVRTLDVYPDPYNYVDQPVQVQGFVIPDERPDHFVIARFLVSCCAADAYPVGLPVLWPGAEDLATDSWLRLEGRMAIEQRNGTSQLVIVAERIEPLPVPVNPYADE
ncbi:TIGR03943 family putative permease subunit [Thermostichus vulcanus]|uniref:TIGR03943 family putative permease subunit n=1 Tax=Thermostichus vulcanus TaxID=32053 RepID=UPI001FCAFD45|nr:TIGR03943 family protein [Thermostichus vulcanus]